MLLSNVIFPVMEDTVIAESTRRLIVVLMKRIQLIANVVQEVVQGNHGMVLLNE
jgi:hypothetical protein